MYTGARVEELAMLKEADLDFDDGVLHVRGTKTNAADRVVPIHPALMLLLSALDAQSKDEYVIEGLALDGRGERGKAIGKRFGRLKTAMGYTGRDKVFHSIRKTVATLLELAEVTEGVPLTSLVMKSKQ
jgi:integrase